MKHAFLILAHNQEELLKKLIKSLDNDRVDIFLHIDQKSKINIDRLGDQIEHSKMFFVPRKAVTWGGYSQIEAEYLLLREAIKNGPYEFYHFLTGQDFLLKTINEVLEEFDKNRGINFISFKQEANAHRDRLIYYYPLQEYIGKSKGVLYKIQRGLTKLQKMVQIERKLPDLVGFGSAYFDITNDFGRFIIDNYNTWKQWYKNTLCADEMFVQTLFSLYRDSHECELVKELDDDISNINKADAAIYRAIDWKRGNPYIWKIEDYSFLKESKLLFVRKIDEDRSRELIEVLLRK